MTEWGSPESVAITSSAVAGIGVALARVKATFSRNRGGRKRDEKKLVDDIDKLQSTVNRLIDLVLPSFARHDGFVDSVRSDIGAIGEKTLSHHKSITDLSTMAKATVPSLKKVQTITLGHERRITALEGSTKTRPGSSRVTKTKNNRKKWAGRPETGR